MRKKGSCLLVLVGSGAQLLQDCWFLQHLGPAEYMDSAQVLLVMASSAQYLPSSHFPGHVEVVGVPPGGT